MCQPRGPERVVLLCRVPVQGVGGGVSLLLWANRELKLIVLRLLVCDGPKKKILLFLKFSYLLYGRTVPLEER